MKSIFSAFMAGIKVPILLSLLTLLLLLSACNSDDNDTCLLPVGNPLKPASQPRSIHNITVPANGLYTTTTNANKEVVHVYGGWLATEITVTTATPKFEVTALGEVHPCATVGYINLSTDSGETTGTFDRGERYTLNSKGYGTIGLNPPLSIVKGADLRIIFGNPNDTYKASPVSNKWCTGKDSHGNGTGCQSNGDGMSVTIGGVGQPITQYTVPSYKGSAPLPAGVVALYGFNFMNLPAGTMGGGNNTYQEYYGAQNTTGSPAGVGDNLFFTFNDNPSNHANHTGEIAVFVRYSPCKLKDGANLQGFVSPPNPNNPAVPLNTPTAATIIDLSGFNPASAPLDLSPYAGQGVLWLSIKSKDASASPSTYYGSYNVTFVPQADMAAAGNSGPTGAELPLLSAAAASMVDVVQSKVNGFQADAFKVFQGPTIVATVRALVALYIIMVCLLYMFGATQMDQKTLVVMVIKIVVVLSITRPDNAALFSTYFFDLFTKGGTYLTTTLTNGATDAGSNQFAFLDAPFAFLLDAATWLRVAALLFFLPNILGIMMVVLIVYAFWNYLKAVYKALVAYIIALLVLSMLLAISPLFLCFILFESTKPLFMSWLRIVVRFTLEPAILFSGLVILSEMTFMGMYNAVKFAACKTCVLQLFFGNFTNQLPQFMLDKLCLHFFMPPVFTPIDLVMGGPGLILVVNCIVVAIFAKLIGEFCGSFLTQTVTSLLGSSQIYSIGIGAATTMIGDQLGALQTTRARMQQFGIEEPMIKATKKAGSIALGGIEAGGRGVARVAKAGARGVRNYLRAGGGAVDPDAAANVREPAANRPLDRPDVGPPQEQPQAPQEQPQAPQEQPPAGNRPPLPDQGDGPGNGGGNRP